MLGDIVDRILREELVGERADRREWLWHRLWELDRTEEFPIWLFGIVDVALWDLEGRVCSASRCTGCSAPIARIDPCVCVHDDLRHARGVPRRLRPVPRARVSGDQASRLGRRPRRRRALPARPRDHVGPDVDLMYDGSAGFDLPDAIYLGRALAEANYRWYEEPIREFSITAYKWLSERVDVPLLVGETSDGSHLNTADFIASGCATYVRTSANHRGGMTGAMRIAHLADSFRLKAEVHGPTETAVHLCMAIPNCTYYESLVTSNPVTREPRVGPDGLVRAPTEPGIALPHFVAEHRATPIS